MISKKENQYGYTVVDCSRSRRCTPFHEGLSYAKPPLPSHAVVTRNLVDETLVSQSSYSETKLISTRKYLVISVAVSSNIAIYRVDLTCAQRLSIGSLLQSFQLQL